MILDNGDITPYNNTPATSFHVKFKINTLWKEL